MNLRRSLSVVFILCLAASTASAQSLAGSTPESQGVSSKGILAFVEAFEKEVDSPHGLVVLRHGHTIAQGWWAPYERESTHMLYSLSKSFTSTAIGLLADEGKIDIDDPVLSFFADDAPKDPSDHLKAMRVRDLLSMTSGHAQDTLGRIMQGGDGNWVRGFLALPVERRPGTLFVYNSGATYMLSAIVHKVTGKSVLEYLTPRLFKPLGIEHAAWEVDPKGINVGGWGLKVTTTDIAKLGQLYLQKGMWKDKRILSEAWVRLATSAQTANGSNAESDWNQGYGFQFWRCRHNGFRGDGAFGQFCVVLPDQDMVIAITAGQGDMQKTLNLLWQHLLPAVHDSALPGDEKAQTALAKKLAALNHAPVKGDATSPMAARISGKTFAFEANGAVFKSVTLKSTDAGMVFTLDSEKGGQKFDLAHGKWLMGESMFYKLGISAVATDGMEKVAASGAWTSPNQYTATIWLVETPFRLDMVFEFDESAEALTLMARMHPLMGKPAAIKGAAKR